MFELEAQISRWREDLVQGQSCQQQDLCELEDHLRETIQHLSKKGLSTEEGFFVACRRLGDTRVLAREFGKISRGSVFRTRLLWMCCGLLGCYFAGQLALSLSSGVILLAAMAGIQGYGLGYLSEFIRVAVFLACLSALLWQVKKDSRRPATWARLHPVQLGILAGVGIVLMTIVPTVATIALSRIVPAEGFGELSIVRNTVAFFGPLLAGLLLVGLTLKLRRDAFGSTAPAVGPTLPDSH